MLAVITQLKTSETRYFHQTFLVTMFESLHLELKEENSYCLLNYLSLFLNFSMASFLIIILFSGNFPPQVPYKVVPLKKCVQTFFVQDFTLVVNAFVEKEILLTHTQNMKFCEKTFSD